MFICFWPTVGFGLLFFFCAVLGPFLSFLTRLARNKAFLPLGFIYLTRQSLLPVS